MTQRSIRDTKRTIEKQNLWHRRVVCPQYLCFAAILLLVFHARLHCDQISMLLLQYLVRKKRMWATIIIQSFLMIFDFGNLLTFSNYRCSRSNQCRLASTYLSQKTWSWDQKIFQTTSGWVQNLNLWHHFWICKLFRIRRPRMVPPLLCLQNDKSFV